MSVDCIKAWEQATNAAHAELRAAFERRGLSKADEQRWFDATITAKRLRAEFDTLVADAVSRIRHKDEESIDWAVRFLEADPWCFRSGYYKSALMQVLQSIDHDGAMILRLTNVVLHQVDLGDRQEFRQTCRLAKRIRNTALIAELKTRLVAADLDRARRALWVLTAFKGVRFAPEEQQAARRLVALGIADESPHQTLSWVRRLAFRFWSDEWEHELVEGALEADESALRLLALVDCFGLSADQEANLALLVMRAIDGEIASESWLEAIAPYVASDDFVSALLDRAESFDGSVQRRSQTALRAIELSGVQY